MSQTLVRPASLKGERFYVEGPEAHHLLRVLRRKVGDPVVLFDGVQRRCRGVIESIHPDIPSAEGRITADLPLSADRYRIRLFQGLPKGSKIDFVIEKAVELGAESIHPFTSERGQVVVDADGAVSKYARWTRLAEAAAKQCERADVPDLSAPAALDSLEGELSAGSTLIFSLSPAAQPLRQTLRSDSGHLLKDNSDIINAVVGPESGFSPAEEAKLVSWGGRLVSIGARVLRTETAGLAALAILHYELNQR